MTFHETPPDKQDELELGPTGTNALEYRIDKLLRENQALAERIVALEIATRIDKKEYTPRDIVRVAVRYAMGNDPHSGLDPHPDTVDAITDGVLARIAVNNARPVKYKDEPWREQSAGCHVDHARAHMDTAWAGVSFKAVWLSDLNQPEAAHAGLRIDFLLWKHAKDNAGSDGK